MVSYPSQAQILLETEATAHSEHGRQRCPCATPAAFLAVFPLKHLWSGNLSGGAALQAGKGRRALRRAGRAGIWYTFIITPLALLPCRTSDQVKEFGMQTPHACSQSGCGKRSRISFLPFSGAGIFPEVFTAPSEVLNFPGPFVAAFPSPELGFDIPRRSASMSSISWKAIG